MQAQRTRVDNATLVLENAYIPHGAMLIENGKILAFGPSENVAGDETAHSIDAQGLYVGPGLVDIHVHAGGKYPFSTNPVEAARHLMAHGVTSVLPTLYYDMDATALLQAMDRIGTAMDQGAAPNIQGFYMEGPYMNPKYGAFADRNQWRGPIRPEAYLPLLKCAGARAKVWAVAPEREGIAKFLADAHAFSPDAVFAVGHSQASAEEVEAMLPLGLRLATHHTNAIGNPPRYLGCHRPGIEDAVYANDEIYAELIVDSMGIHVSPYLLRLIVGRLKRRDRIILISDATAFSGSGSAAGEESDLCFDGNGDLAGSKLTLDVACRNMMRHTGASVAQVFQYASANPARLLGMTDLGSLEVGKRANLVFVDDTFAVKWVVFHGQYQEF